MKYMGSKNRIAKEILPIILEHKNNVRFYIEPFVGGANVIDKIDKSLNRIGFDYLESFEELFKYIDDVISEGY